MSAAKINWDEGPDGELNLILAGDWLLASSLPSVEGFKKRLANTPVPAKLRFQTESLEDWDSALVTNLIGLMRTARDLGIEVDGSGLPEGARRLLKLAFAVKEREGARKSVREKGFLEKIGRLVQESLEDFNDLLKFTGELVLSMGRYLRGTATYLRSDLVQHIQEAGVEALPIVSLISFLIGMIFAFVGVMQLQTFGAGIYTANLVAIAMVREMAPIMTAIIMAGRTGASYAAQIGTMKVNEEVDALTTLGMNPIDFLVTPRMIALVVMMPLLTMYSSLLGIIGGTFVGISMVDVTLVQYVHQTVDAIGLNTVFGGLFKSVVYGSLVALAGCQQGMACGGSAMAVGQATTKAVVMGIVLIVISAATLTVIYINLGI
ncbi:MAG TPA: ABC transporter permease [Xanthomonadales bacterium]|nr:ABC transporter permease [Xanthomonadales bacterium]